MLQTHLGNIFFYDAKPSSLSAFADIFDNQLLKTFTSDNLYQILRYAEEITPDVMIFNLDTTEPQSLLTIADFEKSIARSRCPLIVMQTQNRRFATHPRIAHYLNMPLDYPLLTDIIESYSIGNKKHQIMFLNRYSAPPDHLHQQLRQRNYNCFEVHNADAAGLYLQKNQPRNVWIEYSPEFIAVKHGIQHPRIFYVDRQQDIAEIEKFLQ